MQIFVKTLTGKTITLDTSDYILEVVCSLCHPWSLWCYANIFEDNCNGMQIFVNAIAVLFNALTGNTISQLNPLTTLY